MKKILLTFAFVCLLTLLFVSNNVVASSDNEEQEKIYVSNDIGLKELKVMLEQQKTDFQNNEPFAHKNVSKLTDTDEAVLLYYATTSVDKQKLHSFTYEIEDVETYKQGSKTFVEAYIIRNFVFGKENVETSLGDNIKLEITKNNVINKQSKALSSKTSTSKSSVLEFENEGDNSSDVKLDEFLKNYKNEVQESKKMEDSDYENLDVTESKMLKASAASSGYYGYRAKVYADKYALKPNKNYKYYPNGDCTNFVSQALRAGGMPYFKQWKPYTNAWINAGSFRNYILEPGGIKMKTVKDVYENVRLGDVYHYDTRNKIGLPFPDGWMEHTAIVTSRANNKIYVSYHTSNRKNVTREYFTSKEGGKRYASSIRN
ncbi:amidase domain-containing protein [Bacillus safensis]|uniref:amidase domain-containing protein n=1 Tax=Bacillus safensis TaxID=561879 RepID=UPI00227E98AE|nr:amidase domain-containing protein [Bacillus safensis]MCY7432992.1 amidase domain-containing protein [Bacillus safensis]